MPRKGTPFTPHKTASYETDVKWWAVKAMAGRPLLAGPLKMVLTVHTAPPKKTRSKNADWAVVRPDLDNYQKAILDACNGIVYQDDAQVCMIVAAKIYSREERVEVNVEPVTETDLEVVSGAPRAIEVKRRNCLKCRKLFFSEGPGERTCPQCKVKPQPFRDTAKFIS